MSTIRIDRHVLAKEVIRNSSWCETYGYICKCKVTRLNSRSLSDKLTLVFGYTHMNTNSNYRQPINKQLISKVFFDELVRNFTIVIENWRAHRLHLHRRAFAWAIPLILWFKHTWAQTSIASANKCQWFFFTFGEKETLVEMRVKGTQSCCGSYSLAKLPSKSDNNIMIYKLSNHTDFNLSF